MSVLELTILLLTIATIGQFLYGWAQYIEKQLVLVSSDWVKCKEDLISFLLLETTTQPHVYVQHLSLPNICYHVQLIVDLTAI